MVVALLHPSVVFRNAAPPSKHRRNTSGKRMMTNFIEPHKAAWKIAFEDLKGVLFKLLGNCEIDIQHIGSTAIPDLFAKPILDIDLIMHNKALLGVITARLEKIGYTNRGEQGIRGRFAFRQQSEWTPQTKDNRTWQEHHLYVCYPDSLALKNHLLFRDALLGDKKLVEEYNVLKTSLVQEEGMTREKYTKQKTDFIISVLTKLGLDKDELDEIKKANA
jgi:GrpB-like predicted nucleotidyltransferase (UPF0157 family)